MMPRLVLASASPRRRELLSGLGLAFTVRPVALDESPLPGETPADCVLRLARAKAGTAVAPGEAVLAADTVVAIDGRILGKPRDGDDARGMLRALSGRSHEVFTGVALALGAAVAAECDRTVVRFLPLDEATIEWYVATGEPMDKAGAYAIQGHGALLVERIEGNYANVVGLPLPTVARLCRACGLDLRGFSLPALSRRT